VAEPCICGCGRARAPDSPRFCAICRAAFARSTGARLWSEHRKQYKWRREKAEKELEKHCFAFACWSQKQRQVRSTTEQRSLRHKLRAQRAGKALAELLDALNTRLIAERDEEHAQALALAHAKCRDSERVLLAFRRLMRGLKDTPEDIAKASDFADDCEGCLQDALNAAAVVAPTPIPDWRPAETTPEDFYAL